MKIAVLILLLYLEGYSEPWFIPPNIAEVSKVDYSSKAQNFNARYFLMAKSTVPRIQCTWYRGTSIAILQLY